MELSKITLKGTTYSAKLDFATLSKVQTSLRHQDLKLKFQEIFTEIQEQNFAVMHEVIVQSILRCHSQIKRSTIEDKLDLGELENAFEFLATLVEASMPTADKKKHPAKA